MFTEFHLTLDRGPDGWRVSCQCPTLSGEPPAPIPISDATIKDAEKRAVWLGDFRTHDDAATNGLALYRMFFRGAIGTAFQATLDQTRQRHARLRLLIRYIADKPALHAIPWELLFDGRDFLALNREVLLARSVLQSAPVLAARVPGTIRILHSSACPPSRPRLKLLDEMAAVDDAVSSRPDLADVTPLPKTSATRLREALTHPTRPVHVWHHTGHGGVATAEDGRKFYALALQGEDGTEEACTDAEIVAAVKACPTLRLVILNACEGANPFGMVPLLASMNVPAVIGYRTAVVDSIALGFARELYDGLLTKPIDVAVRDARRGLVGTARPFDWVLPMLFLRTSDPMLPSSSRVPEPARPPVPTVASVPVPTPPAPLPTPGPAYPWLRPKLSVTLRGDEFRSPRPDVADTSVGPVWTDVDVSVPPAREAAFLELLDDLPEPPA